MAPEIWERVQAIYHEALKISPGERAAHVARVCASDPELRREVESLLAYVGKADGLLESPAWEHVPSDSRSTSGTSLPPGFELGPYRIVKLLGAGGMGEVYQATDVRLQRDVAIKILPDSLARDPGRLARFNREARLLAGLNHPHIASIHDVQERAIIMELVEGEKLPGRLPSADAVALARQIAEALEFAHSKGIVHRDLKPANIMLTAEGQVKVLDFGLAKALARDSLAGDPNESPTVTQRSTEAGLILGTAAYMAPEQARGKPVDHRADIWAFGCVLYELLTGDRAFGGETVSDCLSAVISRDPEWDRLPKDTPESVQRVIRRCLAKDPRERLHSMADVRILLDEPDPPQRASPVALRRHWGWVAAAVSTAAAIVLGYLYLRVPAGESNASRFHIVAPPDSPLVSAISGLAVAPDGRSVAFIAGTRSKYMLWVRDMNSLEVRHVVTKGDGAYPFWSPDGSALAFFHGDGSLKKVDLASGSILTLCPAGEISNPLGGAWNPQGVILFARNAATGLFRIPAAGGTPTQATTLDPALNEFDHNFPRFLPDGHRFLYAARQKKDARMIIYLGDLNSKEKRRLLESDSQAEYAPPGYLLFVREGTLMAQPFDAGAGRLSGEAVPVVDKVDYFPGSLGAFSAGANGVLVYSSGGVSLRSQLTWFDRAGKPLGTLGRPGVITYPSLSPDGATVAAQRVEPPGNIRDIWLDDVARDSTHRMMTGGSGFSAWAPDSASFAYLLHRDEKIYRHFLNGAASDEVLANPPTAMRPDDWSPDGRYLLMETGAGKTGNLWVQPLFGDRKPYQFLRSEYQERNAHISPDGRWVVFATNRSRRWEVMVTSFPVAGAQTQVSIDGGNVPFWSRDGKALFYISGRAALMESQVKTEGRFEASVPKPLFTIPADHFQVAASKDGRFLMAADLLTADHPLVAILNWTSLLRKQHRQ